MSDDGTCVGSECWLALLFGKPSTCAFHNAMLHVLVASPSDDDDGVVVYPEPERAA